MSLEFRLTLLRDGGQIGQETYQHINDAIAWFAQDHNMVLTEENAAMFVTHLAITLERIRKGEIVAPLAGMLLEEIQQSPHFAAAKAIAAELETLWKLNFPDNELGFIWLHLCTLLQTEGI